MSNKKINKISYFDYASTTPIHPKILKSMNKISADIWGNPSSIHKEGVLAKKYLEEARKKTASFFSCKTSEIIFTGSGTESNNLAIFGIIYGRENKSTLKPHIISTNIEHPSINEPIKELIRRNEIDVTFVEVEENGIVNLKDIEKSLRPNTILISIQYANSEIGTIQPIQKISKILDLKYNKNNRPIFHIDASQAPLYISVIPETLGVDLITVDGHKIYGPKGVGALYVRKDTKISPIIFGGKQEKNLRSSTENIPAIYAMGEALEMAMKNRKTESERLEKLRNYFFEKITKEIPSAVINGDKENRLPNNVNISISGISGEFSVIYLDAKGISASTKSSCVKDGVSRVITALYGDKKRAEEAIRFTMGKDTTKKDIDKTITILKEIIDNKISLLRN